MYWTTGATFGVLLYITTFNINEKNNIYMRYLYEPIKSICEQLCHIIFYRIDIDYIQDGILESFELLNKIKKNMYNASLQFLWTSLKRFYINIKLKNRICIDNNVNVHSIDVIDQQYNYDIRYDILELIDNKLLNEHTVNTKRGIFLLTLKDYLINNSFDERGFMQYCCQVMNIKRNNYWQLGNSLGIRTLLLNKKIIE